MPGKTVARVKKSHRMPYWYGSTCWRPALLACWAASTTVVTNRRRASPVLSVWLFGPSSQTSTTWYRPWFPYTPPGFSCVWQTFVTASSTDHACGLRRGRACREVFQLLGELAARNIDVTFNLHEAPDRADSDRCGDPARWRWTGLLRGCRAVLSKLLILASSGC